MIASAELQTAVYTALNGQVTGTVHDAVPPTAAPPYTVIGDAVEEPDDTHGTEGSAETFQVDVLSSQLGYKQVKQIAAQVDVILHYATLSLAGGLVAFVQRTANVIYIRDQGNTPGETWRRAVLRYRATIQEA